MPKGESGRLFLAQLFLSCYVMVLKSWVSQNIIPVLIQTGSESRYVRSTLALDSALEKQELTCEGFHIQHPEGGGPERFSHSSYVTHAQHRSAAAPSSGHTCSRTCQRTEYPEGHESLYCFLLASEHYLSQSKLLCQTAEDHLKGRSFLPLGSRGCWVVGRRDRQQGLWVDDILNTGAGAVA